MSFLLDPSPFTPWHLANSAPMGLCVSTEREIVVPVLDKSRESRLHSSPPPSSQQLSVVIPQPQCGSQEGTPTGHDRDKKHTIPTTQPGKHLPSPVTILAAQSINGNFLKEVKKNANAEILKNLQHHEVDGAGEKGGFSRNRWVS